MHKNYADQRQNQLAALTNQAVVHVKQVMAYSAPAITFLAPVNACFAYVSRTLFIAFNAATSASLGKLYVFTKCHSKTRRGGPFYGGLMCMCAHVCLCVCFLNNCKIGANLI